jgi:hypothetical protein
MVTNGCLFETTFTPGIANQPLRPPWASAYYKDPNSSVHTQTTGRFGPLGDFRYDGLGEIHIHKEGIAVVDTLTGAQDTQVAEVEMEIQGGISPWQYWQEWVGGVMLRVLDNDSYYVAGIYHDFLGDLRFGIAKKSGFGFLWLAGTDISDTLTTHTIKFRCEDGLQEAWIDGGSKVSASDTSYDAITGSAGLWAGTRFNRDDKWQGLLFDNFKYVLGNTITMTDLPTGWKIRACSITAVESGAGTAVIDLGGVSPICSGIEVLNGSDVVQHNCTAINVCGGTVFQYIP